MCYEEDSTKDDDKQSGITSEKKIKNNNVMYAVGIICAVGILLISVGVHVLLNANDDDN